MNKNKLIVASAGSGKTTHLVEKAKQILNGNVLIATYTEANENEIIKKFNGKIPENITIQTWFSFLLMHGVRPYQSEMNSDLDERRIGFYLTEEKSGKRTDREGNQIVVKDKTTGKDHSLYWGEKDFYHYYFTNTLKIYSDKIAKFIYECNKKTNGEVLSRISRIFPYIFIDEIQDLAGWELEILKLLFKSKSSILIVGDPRQVVYLTHYPLKYQKYMNGNIKDFIINECNKKKELCAIDENTLSKSHRNNQEICDFSSKLFPQYPHSEQCSCTDCRQNHSDHQGIFLVKHSQVDKYCEIYKPRKLYHHNAEYPDLNYGNSKGLSFENVLIYPTAKIEKYLLNGNISTIETVKSKFYVALTRARYSVGIVHDYIDNQKYINGLKKYK